MLHQFPSIQLLNCAQFFVTPWTTAQQASLSITNSWSLPKLMSIESVMPSNHLILCHPLLLLPSIFPRTRVFSNESVLHIRWPKYFIQVFQSPSNDNSGLVSFTIDCFDFLDFQGTLKSLIQNHSSKASVLQHSAFFMVQISHPYISSVQFSCSVMSDSLQPCRLQHTRLPCPSPAPGVFPNSCPLSQWCHPTISSFVVPLSSHLQSFPGSGSFPMSQFFTSGGWNWSFSFSISPSDKYSGLISFRMDWLDLLAVQGTLKSLLQHHSSKASILWLSAFFMAQLSYPSITTGKP